MSRQAPSAGRQGVGWLIGASRIVGAILGFLFLASAFALAAPLGSSPDEPDHWRFAYAVQTGQDYAGGTVAVPLSLDGFPAACVNMNRDVSASCVPDIEPTQQEVEAFTSAWTYPPVYYWLTGWPLLLDTGEIGLLGVRVASAALSALLVGVALAPWLSAAAWRMRAAVALGAAPSVVYFSGSVNPQGFEVSAMAAAWSLSVAVFLRLRECRYSELPLVLQIGWPLVLVVAIHSRVLTFWFVAVALLASLIACGPSGRSLLRDSRVLAAAAIVFAAAGLRVVSAVRAAGTVPNPDPTGDELSTGDYLVSTLWRALDSPAEALGLLGWLDTEVPSISTALWFLASGALVGILVPHLRRRQVIAAALTLVLLLLTWVALDPVLTRAGGIPFWQPRYGLGLLVGVLIVLASSSELDRRVHPEVAPMPPRSSVTAFMALAAFFAWTSALGYLMVRYMWSAHWFGPIGDATWAPYAEPGLIAVMGVVGAALLAFSALVEPPGGRSRSHHPVDADPVAAIATR